jgi:hypothetical protein
MSHLPISYSVHYPLRYKYTFRIAYRKYDGDETNKNRLGKLREWLFMGKWYFHCKRGRVREMDDEISLADICLLLTPELGGWWV